MQHQVDQFEAEIESLVGAAGKKKKGKSDADARSEECQQWVSEDSNKASIWKIATFCARLRNIETTYRSWRLC